METDVRRDSGFMGSVPTLILRLVALTVIDAFGIWLVFNLWSDGFYPFAIMLALVTIGINVIFLYPRFYPLRWMAPGLALMALMALYPVLYTVYTAFTNYSTGHRLQKEQVIETTVEGARNYYTPEDADPFSWEAFRSTEGGEITYALWITNPEGESFFALPDEPLIPGNEVEVTARDEEGVPTVIAGYQRIPSGQKLQLLDTLSAVEFGEPPATIQVTSFREAQATIRRFVYDEELDAIIDRQTDTTYYATEEEGFFLNEDGETIFPGYQIFIGLENFRRFFSGPAISGPLLRVFIWTFVFALGTVALTFALGLFVAIVFDHPGMAGRKLVRSLLIIPYTLPSVISVLIWRGLLNERLGIVNRTLEDLIGWAPAWLSDPTWAKIAILLINLWLGYPYMMLICSGALQAIPTDIYEAARVDGATTWQRFYNVTLPLLLVSVGPILISSFTFNFNNFNVIYLYNRGRPPIVGADTPAGHTDILVTYTFRLAFEGGQGNDFGLAAAITVVIFAVLLIITLINFRFTRIWEEIGENV